MKQTLKEFLAFGLNKLPIPQQDGPYKNKYQANCTSDFDGAYFTTKAEAKRFWQETKRQK